MKKELVLLVGPPGAGKSTTATEEFSRYNYINQDLQGKDHLNKFKEALINNDNIVVDRLNFNKLQRERYLKPAKELGYATRIIVLHVSTEECMKRLTVREDHPTIKDIHTGRKVLNFFFKSYEPVTDDEADIVERRGWNGTVPAVICDLDGTLCNIDHRLHYVKNGNKDWRMFFEQIPKDNVNLWCEELIQKFGENYPIVLASGRPDDHMNATKEWLDKYRIKYDNLFMRPRGDFRKDDIVKEIILDFEILTRYQVYFVVDDRKSVCSMWRRRGSTCLQCADGEF